MLPHGFTTTLNETIDTAVQALLGSQNRDGAWHDCFETGLMADSHMAIGLSLLQKKDPGWTNGLLQRIISTQRENGSWGLYPGDQGDLSTTVECYYALQLHGAWQHHPASRRKAEQFILSHGGLKRCRNLTKVILAIGGEVPWSWLPTPWLYGCLFAKGFPVSIFDIVTFTRLHISPMIILSAFQYVENRENTLQLQHLILKRKGIYLQEKANPLGWVKSLPVSRKHLRQCIDFMFESLEDDGTVGGYHSSTLLFIFALRALGCENDHPRIQRALKGIRGNLLAKPDSSFTHQQTCNAHIWNTALAAKALMASNLDPLHPSIQSAVKYLLSKQHVRLGRTERKGGWGFSGNNTKYPDNDDTVACLEAIAPYRLQYPEAWMGGSVFLLSMQNKDGGWSAFDHNRCKRWIEKIPANDMKRTMADLSTPDITGRIVEFIARYRIIRPDHAVMQRALRWLIDQQEKDGSWFGRWGNTYLYGTWCAVRALVCVEGGDSKPNLSRAKAWILKVQNDDGGFGEACHSDSSGRFVASPSSPSQTAWGLDTLLALHDAYKSEPATRRQLAEACNRAAEWLLKHQHHGNWPESMPTGSAFPGSLYIRYHIYPRVWPILALSHYRNSIKLPSVEEVIPNGVS